MSVARRNLPSRWRFSGRKLHYRLPGIRLPHCARSQCRAALESGSPRVPARVAARVVLAALDGLDTLHPATNDHDAFSEDDRSIRDGKRRRRDALEGVRLARVAAEIIGMRKRRAGYTVRRKAAPMMKFTAISGHGASSFHELFATDIATKPSLL